MAIFNPKGPHHTEHETGGVDAIAALSAAVITTGTLSAARGGTGTSTGLTVIDGGSITTGTVADARLSSNVPLKNAANVFTVGGQEIVSGTPNPILRQRNTNAPANSRAWQLNVDGAGIYYFVPIQDDN